MYPIFFSQTLCTFVTFILSISQHKYRCDMAYPASQKLKKGSKRSVKMHQNFECPSIKSCRYYSGLPTSQFHRELQSEVPSHHKVWK